MITIHDQDVFPIIDEIETEYFKKFNTPFGINWHISFLTDEKDISKSLAMDILKKVKELKEPLPEPSEKFLYD